MQQFKIKQSGYNEIRQRALVRFIPVMLITSAAGIGISLINSKPEEDATANLPYLIPFILIISIIGLFRGLNRQRKLFESYTLIVDNSLITRKQHDTPTISLYFNEISQVVKAKNGSISIKGKNPADVIIISAQMENYQQLDNLLQQISPNSTPNTLTLYERYQSVIALLSAGSMVCVYTVMNKVIVAFAGTTFIILMIWSLIRIRDNKNVDSKTKRISLVSILVIVSVLTVMYMKLFVL